MRVEEGQKRVGQGIQQLGERFGRLEEGQKQLEQRLTRMEEGQKQVGERLTRLEEGQKQLEQRLTRVEEQQKSLEQRVEEGFAVVNRRIDELREFLLWGFGVTFAGMFALVGFVLWDRRTALAPAVRRIQELQEREQRLEAALREYAATAPELAESLRKMGLL
ncbi:MAG: hemolysin XhlA family protein [Candidatus Binatia bacterium]|nr:hemolysin XhlA family protein [Candidatus Binatia bacterium]